MTQPQFRRPPYRPVPGEADWSGAPSPDEPAPADTGGDRGYRPPSSPARAGRHQNATPPLKRRTVGSSLFGVPVTLIVTVELVLACLIVLDKRKLVPAIIAVVVAALAVVLVLLRRRGTRFGTWLALRGGFRLRHREVLVSATEYTGGEPDAGGVDHIDVPPELHAFFPGIDIWESSTHEGERLGVVQWRGACSATIELTRSAGILRPRTPVVIPAEAVIAAIDGRGLALDAVQILSTTVVGEIDPGTSATVGAATAELYAEAPRVRNRSVYVTVRVEPADAAEAIEARGGGREGIARLLSAALSAIRAGVAMRDFDARPLDSSAIGRAIADSLYHQATAYDPIIAWTETPRDISSSRMAHGSYAVIDVGGGGLTEIPAGNVFAYAVGTQVRPSGAGRYASTTVLRVSCRSRSALDDAGRELRRAARRSGITLRRIDAVQNLGLRATVPIGGV